MLITTESLDLALLSLIPFSMKLPITDVNKKNYSIFNDNKLGPYLAGLIEGDGSIFTPSDTVDSKATRNVPLSIFQLKAGKIESWLCLSIISPSTVEASGFIDLIRSIKNFMYELILLN